MNAANYDIVKNEDGVPYIERGANFNLTFRWRDSAGALIDLTGYTARMQVRSSIDADAVLLSLTTENGGIVLGGANGTVELVMIAAQTAAQTWLKGVYDLELVRSDGYVTRFVQGAIATYKEVTR